MYTEVFLVYYDVLKNDMKNLLLLVIVAFLFACSSKENQSAMAGNKKGLDLEKIDFNEKPLEILKSKIDSSVNNDEDIIDKVDSEAFNYPVNYKTYAWNGENSLYGKAYYSKIIDSIAYFKDIYFNRIAFLVHDGKTVAIFANAEIKSDTVYNDFVKQLDKQFGKRSFSPQTTMDEFYEWTTKDRLIQIDYFTGGSILAMSDKKPEFKQTFDMQMLIFNKDAAKQINQTQQANYAKTKNYKVMHGDFTIYKFDPQKNIILADSLLNEKFK